MRLLISVVLLGTAGLPAGELPYFHVLSENKGAWPEILSSIGMEERPANLAHVFVARAGSPASLDWKPRVDAGAILILEGESSLSELFGFHRSKENVRVGSLTDVHNPELSIVWEKPLELPVFDLPERARVFARDRWTGAPVTAGVKRGMGALLWVAAPPGERGYERFPYLLAALSDLGFEAPFRSARLWAFFDSAYRSRVDLDYFAARWRQAGIAALHVAAWHFYEPNSEADAYLRKLLEACHREGIRVYAWLELPHVSEQFWKEHPEWREKTALLQDAQLDWRKLMNLNNRECFRSVSAGVGELIGRFDWDGVNLAELYFESLEGIDNPSRFTPMNDDVRAEFRAAKGFDPVELFIGRRSNPGSQRTFLDFRRELAGRMEEEWLAVLESIRRNRPELDLVLTHVDDRFDRRMRDAIGSDAGRVLNLQDQHSFTFMIEDPATIWHLGPQRYRTIAESYQSLTAHPEKLAIDLNIVDRYQDVYPTKQQTGSELFQLVHQASANFRRVALYFENSLLGPDLALLSSAAAAVDRIERQGSKIVVDARSDVGLPWKGGAVVDGQLWAAMDAQTLWLPAGIHSVERAPSQEGPKLLRLNAELETAGVVSPTAMEFSYASTGRAIAVLDRSFQRVEIDGADAVPASAGAATLLLPGGKHHITVWTQ